VSCDDGPYADATRLWTPASHDAAFRRREDDVRTSTHDHRRRRSSLARFVLACTVGIGAVLLSTTACAPQVRSAVVENVDLRTQPTARPAPSARLGRSNDAMSAAWLPEPPRSPLPLRGDPTFDPAGLDDLERYWYDELWDTLSDEEFVSYSTEVARRDDLYHYGRTLHTIINSLLTAFRVTGDLALLDEVDRLTEHMRAQLRDGWRNTLDGTNGTRDGFLNWVYRAGGGSTAHQGKDLHVFDEMRTHALVAEFTWAFHNNRDLTSPGDVPYGERADAWQAYLSEHFEAKWRARNGVPGSRLPFLEHDSLHANVAFAKYHHYVGLLRGSARDRTEAERLSQRVLSHFVTVPLDGGQGVVWPRRLEATGDQHYLQPTTYARYVVMDAVTLHLEGARSWSDRRLLDAMAITVRALIIDPAAADITFTRDVGGGVARGGIPASPPTEFDPITENRYANSSYALVAAWDHTGSLATWTHAIHERRSQRTRDVHLPAAMLLTVSSDQRVEAAARR
jgi:hypothetical protein